MSAAKRTLGVVLAVLGVALFAGAAMLAIGNQKEATDADRSARHVMTELADRIEERVNSEEYVPPAVNTVVVHPAETTEQPHMDTVEIDGLSYVGFITVPSLGLELPIQDNVTMDGLKISPCRYYGSPTANNMVICGHNYDRHFGRLKTLTAGDEIVFTNVNGKSYHYSVASLEIVSPYGIKEMTKNEFDLTLFTCTYGGRTRLTVRCLLDEKN